MKFRITIIFQLIVDRFWHVLRVCFVDESWRT